MHDRKLKKHNRDLIWVTYHGDRIKLRDLSDYHLNDIFERIKNGVYKGSYIEESKYHIEQEHNLRKKKLRFKKLKLIYERLEA